MLLRTRITLLVAIGFVLVLAVLTIANRLSDQQDEARFASIATLSRSALWEEIVRGASGSLTALQDDLQDSPAFRNAAHAGDRAGMLAALSAQGLAVGPGDTGTMVVLIGSDREPVATFGAFDAPAPAGAAQGGGADGGTAARAGTTTATATALLDAGTLDRVLGGRRVAGLRQLSANAYVLLAARQIDIGNGPTALLIARSTEEILSHFAELTEAGATLVTLRGRTAGSTDAELWQQAVPELGNGFTPRMPLVEQIGIDGRYFSFISVPITDITGSVTGAVATLRDITDTFGPSRFIARTSLIGALALSLIGIIGLNLYLWRGFRPLESAIGALQAIARGDLSARLEATGTRDEIGRIAEAVDTFRSNARALADARVQRERIRRRQEAVIRHELEGLAAALDSVGREGVLSLLDRKAGEGAPEDPLRRLAGVMRDLSRRIVEQHQTLSSMVHELREALITKTKLAGLQQELEIARQVQLAILPRDVPRDARIEVSGHMTPANEVGGDFFDYFMLDRNTLGFVIADVSGKGVPAALFMAISRTLLKSTALFEPSPAQCLRRINDVLAAENDQMLFVTLVYGVLDLRSGRVTYVNAGHNPPYRIDAGHPPFTLPSTGGMAVAVVEDFPYAEGELTLAPGETLFLFTDGVTEAFDPDGEAYGDARLVDVLDASCTPDTSPAALTEAVRASVRRFERGAPPADDLTCLVVRYRGPGEASVS
ncbi:SpoIIE family protein phosphatase [Ancylobacter sp. 6x-1]|uniref:SpoIIE family protein phosphatase n=1 Tax=Ancylobacter crimeensis TaxID=2579147 RepID=A0ABT0DBJ3_9HYPH|nr:SpoIIE family protein phosphatase [Ancylobacter crimeensis]MCK0197337.1 SpoIIE family protein phosphatase [Ancylobacter crimeensis]